MAPLAIARSHTVGVVGVNYVTRWKKEGLATTVLAAAVRAARRRRQGRGGEGGGGSGAAAEGASRVAPALGAMRGQGFKYEKYTRYI